MSMVFAGYMTPEQVRLSWTNKTDEMRITWVIYSPISNYLYYREILCENRNDDLSDDKDDSKKSSNSKFKSVRSTVYSFHQGSSILPKVQYIHSAVIKVRNECVYEYYAGSWIGWTPKNHFSGRTPSDSDLRYTDIIIVADWGGGSQGQYTKNTLENQLKLNKFDAILHAGDFAYDLDGLDGLVGDSWLKMVEPLTSKLPFMTLPGNHENFQNSSHYKNRFIMPYNEANEGSGYFYSFNLGRAHYVMINTEIYLDGKFYNEAKTQTNWLRKDLKKASKQRKDRPFIIVLTHRNLYCSIDWTKPLKKNEDCAVSAAAIRMHLEKLLNDYHVDLFMQAHVHQYERTLPISFGVPSLTDCTDKECQETCKKKVKCKNQCKEKEDCMKKCFNICRNPKAPIYVTNGNAGNNEGHNDPLSTTRENWSVVNIDRYGYGRLIVYNESHLYYEQYNSKSAWVIDKFWIIKE
jgi:hypothetical protein